METRYLFKQSALVKTTFIKEETYSETIKKQPKLKADFV